MVTHGNIESSRARDRKDEEAGRIRARLKELRARVAEYQASVAEFAGFVRTQRERFERRNLGLEYGPEGARTATSPADHAP